MSHFFFVFLLFSFVWAFFKFFSKSLIVLLSLEGMMLVSICNFSILSKMYFHFLMLVILSIFMVLDSVFGLSLMVASSRSSGLFMKIY